VRGYLGYVGRLLDARTTLAEYRRLLVVGGWLSLLAATTPIDLHRDHAAASEHLRTAAQFARETGHAEIAGWVHGTRPSRCSRSGLPAGPSTPMPPGRSPEIRQHLHPATAQEGRAWARLGADPEIRAALSRVEALVSPP